MSNLAANGAQITVAWGCGRRFEQIPKQRAEYLPNKVYGDTSDRQRGVQARDDSAGTIMYVTGGAEQTWPPALFATLSQSQSQRPGPVSAALALAAALFLGGGDEPCGALGGNDRDGLGASAHRNKLDTTLVTRSQQTTPCNPPASTAQHSTAQHSTARYSHCCPPNAARAAPSPRPPQSNGGAARPRIERVSAGPST
jgi:hypothetical protein